MHDLHVLFVDDDSDESYLFNEALEHAKLNIRLSRASNGNDLLSFLHSQPAPDLVIMDINMPYKDGVEALTEIRKEPRFNNIPLIIYSTSNNKDRINSCFEKGADLFVIKPEDFDELVQMVKKVCTIDWKNYRRVTRENFVIEEDNKRQIN
jgi:CheY-like chemotaxis protein